MPCEACEKINHRKGKDTPCEKCFPDLHPANENALMIYQLVQAQNVKMKDGTPYDIDMGVLVAVLKLYKLDSKKIFNQVVSLSRHMIGRQHNA